MGPRSSSAPRAISDAAQPLQVEPGRAVGDAHQEVTRPTFRLLILLERRGTANGEHVNNLGGWRAGPNDDACASDRAVKLWIAGNLDTGVAAPHTH